MCTPYATSGVMQSSARTSETPVISEVCDSLSFALGDVRPYCYHLFRAFQALTPETSGQCWRGIPADQLGTIQKLYTEGAHIHYSAITSVSKNPDVAKDFARAPGGIIFQINVLRAYNVNDYSFLPREAELLFSPNSQFRVKAVAKKISDPTSKFHGYYIVEMDQLKDEHVVH